MKDVPRLDPQTGEVNTTGVKPYKLSPWEFTINLNMVKLAWLKPGLFSSKRRMNPIKQFKAEFTILVVCVG